MPVRVEIGMNKKIDEKKVKKWRMKWENIGKKSRNKRKED